MQKYLSASFLTTSTLLINKVIAFVLIAILTRMISVSEYGRYSLFTSWIDILSIVVGGSIASSFGIAKRDFNKEYSSYISSCVGLSYLYFFLALFIGFVVNETWQWWYLVIVIMHSFNVNILTDYEVLQNFSFKYVKASTLRIIQTFLSFIVIIVSLKLINNFDKGYIAIIALFCSYLIIAIFCQIDMVTEIYSLVNYEYWKYAFKNSFLMISHNLSLVILNQIDRLMIGNLINTSCVAIYSTIYSLSVIISVIWTGAHKVWLTWLYNKFASNESVFIVNNIIIFLIGWLTINYSFVSPEIIKIFLPDTYWDGINIMPVILFGYFFSFIFSIYVNVAYYYKKIGLITIGTIIAASSNIITNYYFIPIYGYKIAAYTTLTSYFILFIYHYFLNKNNIYFNNKLLFASIFITGLALWFCVVLSEMIIMRYIILVMFDLIVFALIYYFLRKKQLTIQCLFSFIWRK